MSGGLLVAGPGLSGVAPGGLVALGKVWALPRPGVELCPRHWQAARIHCTSRGVRDYLALFVSGLDIESHSIYSFVSGFRSWC